MLKSIYPLQNRHSFDFVMVACALFMLLTLAGMLFYPGGTFTDETAWGYSFFKNFFSDLGLVTSHSGVSNFTSFLLFFTALTLVGLGMGLFFLAFPQFFQSTPSGQRLSAIGSALGLLSALCFLGVACVPADVNLALHKDFVIWAFRFFPAAVLLYTLLMFRENYPKTYRAVFVAFFMLLVAYLLLLELGPDIDTYQGMVIQAVGQKIIVYTSIASVLIQAWGARQLRLAKF